MNHAAKRVIAVILAVMMTLGMTGTALAESAPDEYVLNAERLSDVPEGDLIYLGTASAALDEKTAVYSFPVYREGDASEEASVMLRTLDLSAVYGKDYVLLGSGIEKTGSDTSLLERAAAASKEYEGDEYAAEEGASPEREMRPSVQESSLARLVSEQTGEPTRDLYETSGEDLLSSVVDAFVPEQIDKVDYSAQMSVTFAPGETEKTVRFKILDDNKSEGTEAFSILLADPEGAKLWMVTSLAVSIKDDEPAEHSAVSFSSGSYSSKDGVVTVTVERTGAEYSVCSFTITSAGVTADAGANFPEIQDDFFFSPYETERSFDIPVTGEGTFKLTMSDFAACDAGKCTETQITIEESAVPVLMDASAQLQGSSDYSFNIKVNGKSYKVRYTMPSDYNKHGAAKGMIVDTDYKPELEVGEYFFSLDTKHGGMFTYGSFSGTDPGWRGTMQNKYFFDDSKSMDFDKRYGSLKYYSSWVRDKGTQTTSSTNVFPDYFQCFIPDWKSTSGFGGGQEFAIKYGLFKGDSVSGCGSFSRTQDNCGVRINGMGITEGHYIRVQAIDDTKGKTPKSYLEFYGVAAMYKRLNVSIETPNALMYRLGNMSMQSLAMQAHLKSGAQVLYSGSRDFYANPDASKTNLVVNLDSTALNGHTGIFGHVTGFRLTITGSDNKNKKSVNYPEDFITYLEKHKKEWRKGEAKISEDTVNREITKVKENPAVIPYDRFFFAWIEDVQSDIVKSGYGYYQKLSIRPVVEYNDVTVEVLAPTLGFGTGSFLNIASGRTGTFKCHAGDTLNLTAAAADPETNRVIGYEVSTDGGISYDTITSTPYLFLESNRSYKIRPVISPIRNKIEIVFTDEAAKHLSVSGLFSESEKAQSDVLKEFAGQNILIANPEERTVIAQLEPVKGRIYPINFICEEDDSSIYLPVISMGNDTFCTNSYYHVGAGGVADNIIRVDCVRVNKSELTDFTVSGKLISNFAPIRNNGMENIPLPVVGYTVTAGTNTQTAAGTGGVRPESAVALSDENGAFELSHVMGRSGDVIPVVVTNGVTNGQIMSVTLGQSAKTDAGSLQIRYPYGAPYVMDEMVTCEYTMDEFKKNFDTRENQVRIVDDKLKLSAVVNLNGCPLDRAVFTIYTMDGVKTEYRAEISKTDEELAVFECTTDKMTDVLHSGDRICVRLEYVGDDPSVPTVSYPDVDTGFMFYTANDLVAPKTIEANGMKVDIPVVGASTAHMKSGLLNFNTIRWDDAEDGTPTGYTIYVNADALIDYKGKKPTKEKLEALQKLNSQAKEATGRDDPDRLAGAEGIFEDMEDPLEILNPYRDQSGLSSWRSRLRDMRGQMSDAKDAMGGVPFKWTADVVILLSFNFVYDKEQDEYILLSGTAVIGGTFECSKTWYTALMGVPVFLNVNGKVQIDAVVDYPFPEGEAAYTANDFSNYTGNLSEWLPETKADILLNLSGKVTVGVGMCGVASAGGYIAVNLQCDFPVDGKGRAVGALLNVGGGLHFDVVVASLDLTIAEYTQGWGSLEDNATFSFINGLAKTKVPSKSMSASASLQEAVVVLADENELVTARTYSPGSADMSAFGKPKYSFGGSGENEQTLLSGSAERSSPQLLSLDDERQFMVFIGNSGGTQMLYYSVFDGSSWSYPELVADDGTMDVMPELEWMGNKVLIAWTDANSAFEDSESLDSMLGKMGVSCAIFDPVTNTMGRKITLTDDEYANLDPQICSDGERAYITYMKRDLTNRDVRLQDADDLLDFTGTYSVMACITIDAGYGAVVPDGGGNHERYNTIQHPTIIDPLVLDYNTAAVKVGEGSWMLETYTVDTDGNINDTAEDRELYLAITSVSNNVKYRPIRIMTNAESPSAPKLTRLGDEVWLSWLSEGYVFNMVNVTDLLSALFDPTNDTEEDSVQLDTYAVASAYWEADASDWNWYKKTASDLNMTDEEFEDSIYDDLSRGELRTYSTTFWKDDALQSAGDSYSLVSDGTDVYIFFTAYDQDPDSSGMDLCALRFQNDGESVGFGSAVRLTKGDRVFDELDITMTDDSRAAVVANCYDNLNDGNGGVYRSDNSLVLLNLLPTCTLAVPKGSCSVSGELFPGGVANVSFVLENSGLLNAEGYDVTATLISGGERTELGRITNAEPVMGGESVSLDIGWEVPGDVSGAKIEILASALDENGEVIGGRAVTVIDVPDAVQLEVKDLDVTRGENNGDAHLTATVKNTGSKASSEVGVDLELCRQNGSVLRTIDAGGAPTLSPGEEKAIDIYFTPQESEYNRYDYIDLRLTAVSSEDSDTSYAMLIKSDLYTADINESGPEPEPVPLPSDGGGGGGGGSSAAANAVNTASSDELQNGSVSISSKSARANDTVVVTAYPDEGYRTAGVSVTDASGREVPVTDNGDGTYSFTMPETAVTVTPEFVKAGDADASDVSVRFADVNADAWYCDAVQWAVDNGIMNGVAEILFAPDDSTTRAMVVTMLWRFAGKPEAQAPSGFTDVPKESWYSEAVAWAAESGAVKGITEDTFEPDTPVTREQLAAILYRYAKAQGKGFVGMWAFPLGYADADKVSEYAYEPLCWMTMKGIINGIDGETLAPAADATRAQIAAIFMRFFEEMASEADQTAEVFTVE